MPETTRRLQPPDGGTPPPEDAFVGGRRVFLRPLAWTIAELHRAEFPDEAERYGDAGVEWCAHDNQWILGWAALDAGTGGTTLERQVAWLARVLAARDYPVERLRRDLELAADVVTAELGPSAREVAEVLRAGAASLAPTGSR